MALPTCSWRGFPLALLT